MAAHPSTKEQPGTLQAPAEVQGTKYEVVAEAAMEMAEDALTASGGQRFGLPFLELKARVPIASVHGFGILSLPLRLFLLLPLPLLLALSLPPIAARFHLALFLSRSLAPLSLSLPPSPSLSHCFSLSLSLSGSIKMYARRSQNLQCILAALVKSTLPSPAGQAEHARCLGGGFPERAEVLSENGRVEGGRLFDNMDV